MANADGSKSGGRKKGSTNKVQSKTKEFLRDLINDNQEKIKKELKSLSGKPYLDAIGSLMEYAQPKLARTEVEQEVTVKKRRIGYGDKDETPEE